MAKVKTTANIDGITLPKNPYSWTASVAEFKHLVITTAQNGVDIRADSDGRMAEGFAAQVRQALWSLRTVLANEGMGVENIMTLHHAVSGRQDLAALNRERIEFLGDARPASSLIIVSGFWNPDALYEVSAIAAR